MYKVSALGRLLPGAILLGTILFGMPLWAQTRLQDDLFGQWHAALNNAADSLLAVSAQREPASNLDQGSSAQTSNSASAIVSLATGSRERAWQRLEQLRPLIEPILRQAGVPIELAATVVIESGGQPMALSPKGARGIWQFMPDTARRYGLAVDGSRDERVDVQKSTWAAARYLRDLYQRFGSWQLALAAYNAGEDAVAAASARARSADFTRIRSWLPAETRDYVPAVLSAITRFSRAQRSEFVKTSAARVLYAAATVNQN